MENSNKVENSTIIKDKLILLPLLFLPCLIITRVLDNDTWFLLNSGRYVINNGITHIEPFSIHQNMHFVMQQWLTDVIYWAIYDKFGEHGLFAVVMICYVIIILLMYILTMKISNGNFLVSFSITLLVSVYIYPYMVTRPTIFTLIIILVELILLESYISTNNKKYLIGLPILSLIQINLHAALWPILFVLFLPYIIDSFNFKFSFIQCQGYENKIFIIIILFMLLAGFINPYGIEAMTYLLKSYGYPEMNIIMEIQPPDINNCTGKLIYFCILFIILVYSFYRNGNTKVRYFLLTLGTTIMVLSSIRNIAIFALCSLFPLSYYLKDFYVEKKHELKKSLLVFRIIIITLIVIILTISIYVKSIKENTAKEYEDLNNMIDYIYENEEIERIILYTGFNDGSLVQYRGLPSYIDPRAEVYFYKINKKDDIFKEFVNLQKGELYYKEVLDKYKFTHLIVSINDILNTSLMYDKDYEIIYSNKSYKLFKKID